MDPHGAVAIITGASSGIGAAAARAFANAGADVVLAARSAAALEALAANLPGRPLVVPTDVRHAAEARHLIEQVIAERGQIDLLINNAGVGVAAPVASLPATALHEALEVNLFGPLATIQAALPHMRQRRQGHIINVSSVVGVHTLPYIGGYAATKAALDRLTEALRIELRGSGIAVTLLRPGTTRTPFQSRRLGSGGQVQRRTTPAGVPPAAVARALLRAARRAPRVAYVSFTDRIPLMLASLAPALAERALAWAFRWQSEDMNSNDEVSTQE